MRIKKLTGILLAVLITLAVLPIFPVPARAASGDVKIDAAHFPDETFRSYLQYSINDGSDVLTAEKLASTVALYPVGFGISDLTGIGYFTKLTTLQCQKNQLTSLDLSGNPALTNLSCGGNRLTELDLSGNPELITLICRNNALTSLKLIGNRYIARLHCYGNSIRELNIGGCSYLLKAYNNGTKEEASDYTGWTYGAYEIRTDASASIKTVLPKPSVTTQPSNRTVAAGKYAIFTVKAENAATYRWQYSKDNGSTWKDCASSGSDTAAFRFNP